MINLVITLTALGIIAYVIGYMVNGEISISPVVGVMTGFLHSKTQYEDCNEHTLQVCIFIIAITIVWEEPTG